MISAESPGEHLTPVDLMTLAKDEYFMKECFDLAVKGKGYVSPNPLVGAVLVRNGRTLSRGYHHRFGGAHAEVECLRKYGGSIRGCTLYVNLEPCSHFGKTPPCTDLIIDSGVKKVVIAMQDPNPLVRGRGIRKLKKGGVDVTVGICRDQAKELNSHFVTLVSKRRPFVHLKVAQTIDGRIGLENRKHVNITGKESR